MMMRTSTSHEEMEKPGDSRQWSINTKAFIGDENGNLKALKIVKLDWQMNAETSRLSMQEVPGTEEEIPCDLALLAAGFLHPQQERLLDDLGLEYDERGNIKANKYQSTVNEKVFAAGDCRRGQSLVVWAISEGRETARAVDEFLMGESLLAAKAVSMLTPEFAHV